MRVCVRECVSMRVCVCVDGCGYGCERIGLGKCVSMCVFLCMCVCARAR
jgi:hypothetical protein